MSVRNLLLLTLNSVLLTLLASCEPEINRVEVSLNSLSASEIMETDCVYFFRQKISEDQIKLAKDYHERAALVLPGDPGKGVYLLKRSISLEPTFAKYAELGDAYLANQQFAEARETFNFLCYKPYVRLDEKSSLDTFFLGMPDENVYYKLMLSELLANNQIWGETYWMVKDAGLDMQKVRDRLLSDPVFPYAKGSSAYQNIMVQFMSDDEIEKYKNSPEGFRHFFESIADSSEMFEIKGEELAAFNYHSDEVNYDEMMSWQSADQLHIYFLKEKQDDPDTYLKYDLHHRYKLNKNVNVVVYAIDSSATACPADMRHIFHRLVTYDNKGKIIDSRIIAWQDGISAAEVLVKKDVIMIYQKERKWKNEYNKNDFDNELLTTEFAAQTKILINSDGTLNELPGIN